LDIQALCLSQQKGMAQCHPFFVPDSRQDYFFFAGAFFAVAFFAVPQPPPFDLQAMITSFSERCSFKLSQQQLSVNK